MFHYFSSLYVTCIDRATVRIRYYLQFTINLNPWLNSKQAHGMSIAELGMPSAGITFIEAFCELLLGMQQSHPPMCSDIPLEASFCSTASAGRKGGGLLAHFGHVIPTTWSLSRIYSECMHIYKIQNYYWFVWFEWFVMRSMFFLCKPSTS